MKTFYWSEMEYSLPERMRTGNARLGARIRALAAARGVDVSASAATKYYSAAQQTAMVNFLMGGEAIRLVFALKAKAAGADTVEIVTA